MAARACKISEQEMHDHLTGLGFRPMTIPGTRELIYGRIINTASGHRISQRVYTTIYHGETLEKGQKAIYVKLFFMYDSNPVIIGKTVRCLRVTNWRENVAEAVAKYEDNFCVCPVCGNPMVWREPDAARGQTFKPFWGCVTYFKTYCPGRPKNTPNAPAPRLCPVCRIPLEQAEDVYYCPNGCDRPADLAPSTIPMTPAPSTHKTFDDLLKARTR